MLWRKKYVDKTMLGGGAVVGKNVTISSIVPITGGNRVTFSYTLDDGTVNTSSMDVMDGVDGKDGLSGDDGVGISKIEKINTIDLVDTYRITFTDGSTFDYVITNGARGERGIQGIRGERGIQGIQGERGADGYPFLIYKEYSDISEFNKNDFPEVGLMFMIKSDGASSFPVYRYTGNTSTPYSFVTELTGGEAIKGERGERGEQGIQGERGSDGITYTPAIGSVTSGDTASASVVTDDDTATATFNFVVPKGDKGDSGSDGVDGSDGITPHIDSATKHWFIGETDTGILAEGTDGATPYIGNNGNWFINNTDTGVLAQGKDGKSIKSITKDDNNNIIVTFSDNTTQNIGKLTVDVQADFLSSDGFGKLRYYNSHFQYYDEATSAWVDTSVTPDNVYVMNIAPQSMQSITCTFDRKLNKLKLKFKEPADTVVDGQAMCIVEKVVIRRKFGSAPLNENDGDFVLEVLRNSFGSYIKEWFVDDGVTPSIGDTYFYKAFPISTTGFYNYSDLNVTSVTCKEAVVYGFRIDQNESDPASMITYIEENENFTPAHMDYTNGVFDYGDWADIWFIKNLKPCMLKYDGTVDYELDKDDYSKKTDGTASDVANTSYEGNAMIGIPKVYWKIVDNGDNTADIYFSEDKVDDNFHCWSHIDSEGNEIDYCYMSIYMASRNSNKLRSISGATISNSITIADQIAYAEANNVSGQHIWNIDTYCDRVLINLLLTLIGKSTNSQAIFGSGINSSTPGKLNKKGLFYGTESSDKAKVFGMEDWWGCYWRNIVGWINGKNKTQLIKMTYGQSDGSTVDGYNTDGSGYINAITLDNLGKGLISSMYFTKYGLFPNETNGSTSTYYCDKNDYISNFTGYTSFGGTYYDNNDTEGMWATVLYFSLSNQSVDIGTGISCKPLA